MYKALLALAASAGAFAPNVHQRATVVQQGVPLAWDPAQKRDAELHFTVELIPDQEPAETPA